jgi:CRP-like cAMP-binding protein
MSVDPERLTFRPGDVIFRQDDPGECAYFIEEGTVEIERDADGRTLKLGTMEKGRLLGEIALIDRGVRSGTATAKTTVTCLLITREHFDRYMNGLDPLMRMIIGTLIKYVRTNNEMLQR